MDHPLTAAGHAPLAGPDVAPHRAAFVGAGEGAGADRRNADGLVGDALRAASAGSPAARLGAVCRALRDATEPQAGSRWRVALAGFGAPVPTQLALEATGDGAAGDGARGDGVGTAAERVAGLLAQLRAGVTTYVGAQRADGARPEQMLVHVKALVRDAMAAADWHDPEATRALTAQVVGWSIAAYYDR